MVENELTTLYYNKSFFPGREIEWPENEIFGGRL